jgi:hypothetical protein
VDTCRSDRTYLHDTAAHKGMACHGHAPLLTNRIPATGCTLLEQPFISDGYALAAQRWASPAPLAASLDGTARWHATRMKNAPIFLTRQRRQVRAMLGGEFDKSETNSLL